MKNILIAAATMAALSCLPVHGAAAASPDELTQIRSQLQQLIQRVDRLEQENTALKTENEQLKAQDEYLKAETRGLRKDSATQATEVAKVKGADWAQKVTLKGDLRYRHEQINDDTVNAAGVQSTADRSRHRMRARFNAEVKATEDIAVGIGFATAEAGDPRSSNQSFTDVFSRKSLDLDTAYFDWTFASGGHLIGGKMKQPFFKPGQTLFWDNDINPEGLALTFERGMFFGSAYGYWVDEISGAQNTTTADTMLYGGQIGARLPVGASNLVLAAHYYDLSAGQGRAPFYDGDPNGNTTIEVGTPPVEVLLHDYEVVNLMAEFNATAAGRPLQLWAEIAQNQSLDDLDTAWAAGVVFGKASDYRTWEIGAVWQLIEKDALFAQLIDSDFANGLSDSQGWALRAAYAPVKNWVLNATYFLNQRNVDVANAAGDTEVDYDRLQVDFNVKF